MHSEAVEDWRVRVGVDEVCGWDMMGFGGDMGEIGEWAAPEDCCVKATEFFRWGDGTEVTGDCQSEGGFWGFL